jgi:DNA-3-methyladenine glycosylase II
MESLGSKDDKMKMLMDAVGEIHREYIPDPFVALVNSIVFQQLAYKAAISIWNKFEQFIGEITPDHILNASFESLRECGLSTTKISYIKNIAEAVKRKEVDLSNFEMMSDEEIIEKLIQVKGIGTWTAEMFLIFSLNRKDVMSYKDLGIRKGLKWLYNMKEEPTMEQFEKLKRKFSPNNTLVSFYLWEITIGNYFKYKNVEELVCTNNVTYFDSPIGRIEIQSTEGQIIGLNFIETKRYDEKIEPILEEAKKQLVEYFCGERKTFDLPLKMNGTDFQTTVWQELIKIPYGKTLSYGDIAAAIGNEKASRAVGNANNKNRIAILIPCHRVVGSSGKLVGYAGGLSRKEWLLKHEESMNIDKRV